VLCGLRWRDVDFDTGWLRVGEAKTDAGTRQICLRPALKAALERVRRARRPPANRSTKPDSRNAPGVIRTRDLPLRRPFLAWSGLSWRSPKWLYCWRFAYPAQGRMWPNGVGHVCTLFAP